MDSTETAPLNGEAEAFRNMASQRAAATPAPGPVLAAFTAGPISVGNFSIRPVVASDWIIFQQIKSPWLEMALESTKPEGSQEETPWTEQDTWDSVWQFTHSPAECRALAAKGLQTWKDTVRADIGDSPEYSAHIDAISIAVQSQVVNHWKTRIAVVAKAEEDGVIKNFLDMSRVPKTVSAG